VKPEIREPHEPTGRLEGVTRRRPAALALIGVLLVAGCSAGQATFAPAGGGSVATTIPATESPPGGNPTPGMNTPGPIGGGGGGSATAIPVPVVSALPATPIVPPATAGIIATPRPSRITAAEAVMLVVRTNARFAALTPRNPTLIGQGSWYEVQPQGEGFRVTIHVGWGDCQAGCIGNHEWVYDVSARGGVTLRGETGDPLPSAATGVSGIVTAGPVCPVERIPPDPQCAPRPVTRAVLVILDAGGREVGRATSGVDGWYRLDLAPGSYSLVAQPVQGLMGTPAPISFTVDASSNGQVRVDVGYDTGIR